MNCKRLVLLAASFALLASVSPTSAQTGHIHGPDCAHGTEAFERLKRDLPKATPATPTVANYAFNPNVIAPSATGQIRLSARLTGPAPTRAELVSQWGVSYPLVDAGGVEDAVAGDGIYSVNLPVQQITSRYVASDIGRVFVGYLDLYTGATRGDRYNIFAQVRSPEMPSVAVKPLSANAQLSTRVLNLSLPALYRTHDADMPSVEAIAKTAYSFLPDNFDFLNVAFDRMQIENRYHFGTKNDISGIGITTGFNRTADYGSTGKLLGVSVFPNADFFDGANNGHTHELGHQWLAFLKNTELASGVPHWPASTMAGGIMGFSIPGSGAGGYFACELTPEGAGLRVRRNNALLSPVFNPLDLYLMGLLPPAEVPDQWVITDSSFAANQDTLCDGRLLTTGFKRLTMTEVLAANGTRTPDHTLAQRTFRVATIVLSDGLLSNEAMSFYDYFAQRMEAQQMIATHDGFTKQQSAPFFVATGGRGALIATVDPAVAVTTKVTVVEYLNSQLNYYFFTSRDNEKALLDAAPGWARTGATFIVFANPEPNTSGNVRFYFDQIAKVPSTGTTRGSHFYTLNPADIAALQALNPTNAAMPKLPVNEGVDSFAYRPVGSGATATCTSGTIAVYRLFRGSARFPDDPNHRFTTSKAVYDQFVAAGWDGEGVNFCVPAA